MTARLSPSLSFDAVGATERQLDALEDHFMSLLVYTDLLVAEGYEVTSETKYSLLRLVALLRAVRRELVSLKAVYGGIRQARDHSARS